ncbi:MAG TPA: hypothetical protein VK934_09755 [Fimbriimonas sp.]|nr:hypothetical protein [Fimbriimonas sp.]
MRNFRTGCLCGLLLAPLSAVAADEKFPLQSVSVIHESFFISTPAFRGLVHRAEWLEVKARVNKNWSATITDLQFRDRNILDETYLQYENDMLMGRAGRLRGAFGLGDWSDLFYNVVTRQPMIRSMPVLDRYALNGFTSGGEAHLFQDGMQLSLQYGDSTLTERQFLPHKGNVGQARLSGTIGDAAVGTSFAKIGNGPFGPGGQVFGLDLDHVANRVHLRAELMASQGSGLTSKGYFADLGYRLPGNIRTEIGVRLEEYAMGSTRERMMTAGARYVPLPQLAFNLNYGWEPKFGWLNADAGQPGAPFNKAYASTLRGWFFQTMLAFRFKT